MIGILASYPRSGNTYFRHVSHTCYGVMHTDVYNEKSSTDDGEGDLFGVRQHNMKKAAVVKQLKEDKRLWLVKTHAKQAPKTLPNDAPVILLMRNPIAAGISLARMIAREKMKDERQWEGVLLGMIKKDRWGPWQDQVDYWLGEMDLGRRVVVPVFMEQLIGWPMITVKMALYEIGYDGGAIDDHPKSWHSLNKRYSAMFNKSNGCEWRHEYGYIPVVKAFAEKNAGAEKFYDAARVKYTGFWV